MHDHRRGLNLNYRLSFGDSESQRRELSNGGNESWRGSLGNRAENNKNTVGGGSPPRGVIHPSLAKLQNIIPLLARCQDASLEVLIEAGVAGQLVSINCCSLRFSITEDDASIDLFAINWPIWENGCKTVAKCFSSVPYRRLLGF